MFALETNVISELRHGKPHQSPEVRACAGAQRARMLYLSAITILKLELGIQALERRSPPQGSALRIWLTGVRVTAYPRSALRARRNDCRNRDRVSVHRCDSQNGGLCQYRRGACQSVAGVSRGGAPVKHWRWMCPTARMLSRDLHTAREYAAVHA